MKIGNLLKNQTKPFFSLEFFPPKHREKWNDFFNVVQRLKAINPIFASVTCGAGGSSNNNTVEIASKIQNEYHIECMAHCTCVRSDFQNMQAYFNELQRVGVNNILALRGDKPRNEQGEVDETLISHEFKYAEDLVKFSKQNFPDFGIAVAAYPAPHPDSTSFSADREFLAQKVLAGADFAITQLFFDNREYFDLLEYFGKKNINCPIIPGILPIQSLGSLKHTLGLCGANIPGKLYLSLEEADKEGGTELVKAVGLKYAVKQIKELLNNGAPGIHLYTLNRAELCLQLVDLVENA